MLLAAVATGLAGAPAASATPYGSAVLGSSPTTYYRFTETTGTTAFNDVATGPNATYGATGVGLGRQGVDGAADTTFNVGGSGSVTAPDTTATSPTGDFALEAWVRPNNAVASAQHIVSKYGHHSTTGGVNDEKDGYAIRTNADGSVAVFVNSGTIAPVLNSTAKLQAGRWTHLVVTADASGVKLYVNGQLDASAALAGALTRSPNPLYIGAASGPSYHRGSAGFDGRIDEVSIYDSALSAAAVSDHFSKVVTYPELYKSGVVSGYAVPGGTVSVSNGVWAPAVAPTFSYQWKRCTSATGGCTAISGATGQSYVVQSADANMRLTADVTATNSVASLRTTPTPSMPVGYAGAVGSASPTSYFRLGEAAGATTATNEFYLGGHGTYGSGITFGKEGVASPDTSVQFNGSAAMTVPDSAGTGPTADFALEAWVKPNSAVTTPQHILSKYGHHSTTGGANDEQDGYAIRTNADGSLAVYVNSGTIAPVMNSTAKLQAGRWYHLVVAAAGTSLKLYVNGQLDASATISGTLTRSPNPLYVGAASGPSYHRGTAGFNGRIDEVAIYDSQLTATQVTDHFSRGIPYPEIITSPQVSGRAVPGSTMSVSPGSWSPPVTPTITHQWMRCTSATGGCTNIAGATGSTYVAQNADAGFRLTARTTAANAAGSAITTPMPSAQVGYAGAVVADGAGSYMRLGEASGSTAAKNEFSAAGDGTYGTGVALGKRGIDPTDTAAELSGGGYVTGSLSGLNGPTADFAVEVWVKPSSIGGGAHLVSKYGHYSASGGADDEADGFALRMKADGALAMHVNSAGIVAPVLNSNEKLVPGRWYHLVASAVSTNLRIFINGRLDSSVYLPNALTRSPNPLMIGAASGPSYHRGTAVFSGRIDDVTIYDMSLSQAQVSDHFARGVPAPENLTPPAISGVAENGATLTASSGTWSPPVAPSYSYQWLQCPDASGTGCTSILGATSSAYVAQNGDIGKRLVVRVTATNSSGSATVDAPPSPVVKVRDVTDPAIALSGALRERAGRWIGDASYGLHIVASDGVPAAPGSGVASVEVKVDGTRAALWSQTCPGGNCTLTRDFALDAAPLAPGPHSVAVVATDVAGRTTTETWTVKRDAARPQQTLGGTLYDGREQWLAGGVQSVTVNASDGQPLDPSSGVTRVELSVDGAVVDHVAQPCVGDSCSLSAQFTVDVSQLATGTHELAVKSIDDAGLSTVSSWQIRVDRTAPHVDVWGGLAEQVGEPLTERSYQLRVDAWDADETLAGSGVASIVIEIDGVTVARSLQPCTAADGPCPLVRDYTFRTSDYPAGAHTLRVEVKDRVNNATVQTLEVGQ